MSSVSLLSLERIKETPRPQGQRPTEAPQKLPGSSPHSHLRSEPVPPCRPLYSPPQAVCHTAASAETQALSPSFYQKAGNSSHWFVAPGSWRWDALVSGCDFASSIVARTGACGISTAMTSCGCVCKNGLLSCTPHSRVSRPASLCSHTTFFRLLWSLSNTGFYLQAAMHPLS